MVYGYLKSTDDGSTAVTTRIQIQSVTATIHVSVQDLVLKEEKKKTGGEARAC